MTSLTGGKLFIVKWPVVIFELNPDSSPEFEFPRPFPRVLLVLHHHLVVVGRHQHVPDLHEGGVPDGLLLGHDPTFGAGLSGIQIRRVNANPALWLRMLPLRVERAQRRRPVRPVMMVMSHFPLFDVPEKKSSTSEIRVAEKLLQYLQSARFLSCKWNIPATFLKLATDKWHRGWIVLYYLTFFTLDFQSTSLSM